MTAPADLLVEARDIHERALVVLMHAELIADVAERRTGGARGVLMESHAARFRDAAIDCVCNYVIGDTFQTTRFPSAALLHGYYPPRAYAPSLLKHALRLLGHILDDVHESAADWAPATSTEEIQTAARSGRIAMVLAARGATFLEEQPLLLSIFQQLGLRVISLVSDRSNAAAPAAGDGARDGLTDLGKAIIREARRLNLVIDAAWLSRRAFWQVTELVNGPIVVSLGNARRLCAHPANLDDDQLGAVAQSGGVIGVHADAAAVSTSDATVRAFVDHVEYIIQQAGIDHVGIGLNLCEPSMIPMDTYARLFPEDAAALANRQVTRDLSTHAGLLTVTAELRRRQYAPGDIRKILGENALRVYGMVWGEAATASSLAG